VSSSSKPSYQLVPKPSSLAQIAAAGAAAEEVRLRMEALQQIADLEVARVLVELQDHQCKWPLWGHLPVRSGVDKHCGKDRVYLVRDDGDDRLSPYCREHTPVAYKNARMRD
jgi:hypothetical protein